MGTPQLSNVGPSTWPELNQLLPSSPVSNRVGKKDAVVIVGIDQYAFTSNVPGASQNALDWYNYHTGTRQVPPDKVTLLTNQEATRESILDAASQAAAQVMEDGVLWFVFIGHGAPAKEGKGGLLVGMDAQQKANSLYARGVSQEELLKEMQKGLPHKNMVMIDACFSGRDTNGKTLVKGLQPLLPVFETQGLGEKTTLITAGQSNQFAGPLPGLDRPAFSYLMLGALLGWGDKNKDGLVTAEEAVHYSRSALQTVVTDRKQTPQLFGNGSQVVLSKGKEKGPDLKAMVNARVTTPVIPGKIPEKENSPQHKAVLNARVSTPEQSPRAPAKKTKPEKSTLVELCSLIYNSDYSKCATNINEFQLNDVSYKFQKDYQCKLKRSNSLFEVTCSGFLRPLNNRNKKESGKVELISSCYVIYRADLTRCSNSINMFLADEIPQELNPDYKCNRKDDHSLYEATCKGTTRVED